MAVGTQYSYNVNGLKCSVQLYFEITNQNYDVCAKYEICQKIS